MKLKNNRLVLITAILAALAAGFGLARLTGDRSGEAAHTEGATHAEGEGAQAGEKGHTDEGGKADAHADEGGKADAHADEGGAQGGKEAKKEEGVVALTKAQIDASGITVVAVSRGGGGETRLSGRVEPAIGARAAVASSIAGRVERILVAPGTRVKAGQPLAVVISGEAATMRANAEAARAEAEAARLLFRRDQSLVSQGVVARQELEASRARSLAADAAARAASAQASAAGMPDASGRATISSPMSGVVGAVQVTPGGVVSAGDVVANVSDPSQSELVFSAPPALAAQVEPGARIEVAGPAGNFSAVVIGAAADVREQGGMAVIRARAESGNLPPAGSPVAGIVVSAGQSKTLTVPTNAVQTVENRSVVFVSSYAGFRMVPVLAGRRAGDHVEILNGLSGNERVAATNAFLLKAELAKGEAEHGH